MTLRYLQTLAAYPYTPKNRARGCCDVEIYAGDDGKYHVFLIERSDNPGMSVTNAVEALASQVLFTLRGHLKIHAAPEDVVWYDVSEGEHDVSTVSLSWDPLREEYRSPQWAHVKDPRYPQ